MVVNTWDGAANTNWNDAGNWNSTGVTDRVPTSNDDVIIPDTSSTNNPTLTQDQPVQSLTMQANATVVGAGFKITIHGESSNVAVDNDAIISGNLDLEILTAGATTLDLAGTSGNFRNLTINHASCNATLLSGATLDGNLTITAGTLDTDSSNNYALTVAGHTAISSGGTLTLNASTCTFTGFLRNQGTFTGGSGTHTFGNGLRNDNNMTLTSGETRITGRGTGSLPDGNSTICFDDQGGTMNNGSGTINIGNGGDLGGTTNIRPSTSHDLNNVIINTTNSRTVKLESDCDIAGNLTITAGTFDTSTSNRALTVGGGIKNTGTLTANASTILITGEIAGFAFDQMGTFNAGTSTIQIGDGSTSTVGSSTHFKSNNCHNLIINQHQDAPNGNVAWRAYTGTEVTIGGNLTVTRGRFYRNTSTQDLTVTGHVNIASVGKLGTEAASGSNTFGTLTIASGGTYQATSETTTITQANGAPVNGRCWFIPNSATFTHNNGLCKFTASSPQVEMVSSGGTSTPNPFYDVEQTAGTMQWKGEHTKVLNNATLRGSQFNGSTGNLTVLGICRFTAGTFNASDTSTSDNSFFGTLVIESGATVDLSAIDITVGSVRNLGGTIQ